MLDVGFLSRSLDPETDVGRAASATRVDVASRARLW